MERMLQGFEAGEIARRQSSDDSQLLGDLLVDLGVLDHSLMP